MKTIKKISIFLLLISLCFVCFSCSIDTSHRNPNYPEKPAELKASRLLNNVEHSASGGEYIDQEVIDELINSSFDLYQIITSNNEDNLIISPISLYMAFSLLHMVGNDTVKKEVEELLGVDSSIIDSAKLVYQYLTKKVELDNSVSLQPVYLSNSIWLDNIYTEFANQSVLDELAEKYYCYAYEAPFSSNNEQANQDIRDFIKEQTKGLIDQDFDISDDTIFALINTLYFYENWLKDKALDTKEDIFHLEKDTINVEYLIGPYTKGVVYKEKEGQAFYLETENGYKLHIFMPNDGVSVSSMMNAEFFKKALESYNEYIFDGKKHYTKTIFPSFNVTSDYDVKDIIQGKGYLEHTFSYFNSELLQEPLYVSEIIQKAKLKVDKKGVEGAAVTIISGNKSAGLPEQAIYQEFLVNKEFGYVLTSPDNIILFMGQITNPNK